MRMKVKTFAQRLFSMNFLPEAIEEYASQNTKPESSELHELTRETWQTMVLPRMSSGHYQGKFLSMIAHMIRPSRVLEIGTYTAYSTWCLAEGLNEGGELITIDINDELQRFHKKYAPRMKNGERVVFKYGDAMKEIPQLEGTFDLIFIDADKENYIHYYEMLFPKLKLGGWMLIDNVLWSGKVVEPVKGNDIETLTLLELNKKVTEDARVDNLLLSIRDGLMMVRRIA
jgi:predicted O-methyltransferase YrrM